MAYTIGSQKGKQIANSMKAGETYKASDGSTWKKNSDGTVSVTASNGAYTANALAGAGTSKSTGTSSSSKNGGASTSKRSGGTTINGVTYGTGNGGLQSDISKAVAAGNYALAAQLEQARNQKIDSTGSPYDKTNLYSGWLPGSTDYGIIGQNQMASGASWQDVLETYNNRANKAAGTVGMEQYVNDAVQQEMLNYILNNMQEVPPFDYDQYLAENPRPSYESQYGSQIDGLLDQILNRDDFSYDASKDPLFAQYQAMYQREGNRAMNDTLASAAAGAGGMNSYAITAAQQANDYYNAQIGDKIPELYQLAYQMYLQDIDNDVQNLGLLQNMDSTQYNRYRDTMNDWYNDLNFAYGRYRDDVGDSQWLKQFDYNAGRDQIADQRYDQEWAYNTGRDQIGDQRYDREQAYNKAMELLSAGVMPGTDTLAAAGITAAEASAYIAARKAKQASGSGGGSSSGSNDLLEALLGGKDGEEDGGNTGNNDLYASLLDLGIGPISASLAEELLDAGGIIETKNGFQWANGWNAANYKGMLSKRDSLTGGIKGF